MQQLENFTTIKTVCTYIHIVTSKTVSFNSKNQTDRLKSSKEVIMLHYHFQVTSCLIKLTIRLIYDSQVLLILNFKSDKINLK